MGSRRRTRVGDSSAAACACEMGRGQHGGALGLRQKYRKGMPGSVPRVTRGCLSPQFYGPRIGALYVRGPGTTTPLHPMLFGGGQERTFRPG